MWRGRGLCGNVPVPPYMLISAGVSGGHLTHSLVNLNQLQTQLMPHIHFNQLPSTSVGTLRIVLSQMPLGDTCSELNSIVVLATSYSPLHTWYLSRTPRVYSCKFFLAGVNFYRFTANNWHFGQILREKVAFFTYLTRKIFRCKFYSPKILPV